MFTSVYLKLGIIVALVASLIGTGWYLSEKIRVNPIQMQLRQAVELNVGNAEALKQFKESSSNVMDSYEKRLKQKDSLILKLREICSLRTPTLDIKDIQRGGKDLNGKDNNNNDIISDMLNGLFSNR